MNLALRNRWILWFLVLGLVAGISVICLYPIHRRRVQAEDAKSDFSKTGGVSNRLLMTIAFEPKSRFFHIRLKNTWHEGFELLVDPAVFYGRLIVSARGSGPKEYYRKEVREKLKGAFWLDPKQKLEKEAGIEWDVPITDFRDANDRTLTSQDLRDATIYAELDRVAIIPPRTLLPPRGHNFQTSNAVQRSTAITIQSP